MRPTLLAAALAALTAAAPAPRMPLDSEARARGAETPEWAKPYLGRWSLTEDGDGGQGCTLRFTPGLSVGGAQLALTPACRRLFPLEDVTGWRLSAQGVPPHIEFIGALRETVLDFEPLKGLPWSAALPDRDGLPRPAALLEREARWPSPGRSSVRRLLAEGTFDLSGPNMKDWCGFAVTVSGATGGELRQQGRCAVRWKGKGWASWAWTGSALRLKDRRGVAILTLTRGDDSTFVGGSDSDPLFFGPGVVVVS